MEPPQKRLRLDPTPNATDNEGEDQDELSMTPAQFDVTQDPMYELDKGRAKAATRLKSAFEDIFEKYGKDFTGADDVINFYTDEIEVDNGHVQSLANQKNDATEDPISSDEESRILNGKSNARGKKSRSRSLVPANHVKYGQAPQFGSPWNEPLDAGAYRLSSFAFPPSPYGAGPSFDFGRPFFGNAPIDPIWAAPDLPVQTPNYLYGTLMGLGTSHSSLFGGQSNQLYKRRVSAKVFRLRAASSKQGNNNGRGDGGDGGDGDDGDDGDDEDDILLGRNEIESPDPNLESTENSLVLRGSRTGSYKSIRNADQQPTFRGLDTPRDQQQSSPGSLGSEPARASRARPLMRDIIIGFHQTAKQGTRQRHEADNSPGPSPSHQRKAQPRKRGRSHNSAPAPNQAPRVELRQLKQNERRIEVIIPMMKRLLSTEVKQTTKETEPIQRDTPRELDIEATQDDNSSNSSQPTGDDEDIMSRPSSRGRTYNLRSVNQENETQIAQSPKAAPSPSNGENIPLRRSTRKRKQTDFLGMVVEPHGANSPEILFHEASQESESSQTESDSFIDDNVAKDSARTQRKSHHSIQTEQEALDQQLSPIQSTDSSEDEAAHSTIAEESAKSTLVGERNSTKASMRSSSLLEDTHRNTGSTTDENSDPAYTEGSVFELIVPQGPGTSHDDEQDVLDVDPVLVSELGSENALMQLSLSEMVGEGADENAYSTSTEEIVLEKVALQESDRSHGDDEDVLRVSPTLVDERKARKVSIQPPSSPEKAHRTSDSSTDKNSNLAKEKVTSKATVSEKLGSSHGNDEEPLRVEPSPSPTSFHEEDIHSTSTHFSDSTMPPQHDPMLKDVVSSSERLDAHQAQIAKLEHDTRYPSPELQAIHETIESDAYPVQGSRSSTPEASGTSQSHSTFDQSFTRNAVLAGIDRQQLDAGRPDVERSPSLGAAEPSGHNSLTSAQLPTSTLALRFLPPPTQTNTRNNIRSSTPTEANAQNPAIRYPSPELGTPNGPELIQGIIPQPKPSPTPKTPTKKRSAKSRHTLSPSKKRFPLTSLIPDGSDDENDNEDDIAASFSSKPHNPFSQTETPALPPLYTTPHRPRNRNNPPATESRAGRSKSRQHRGRAVHSSPLARTVAERLLSSPTKGSRAKRPRSPSPRGTCGKDGFVCGRAFCLTCCV
ncbi:hypothetical protein F4861DRAFT_435458 [Xylaria intraflava]|nr:hypothetical protein F4861DRAFT_435458 [Xylaria intraflava]